MSKKPLEEPKPFDSPFAKLGGLRAQLSPGPAPTSVAEPRAKPTPARAVVRIERKGHAGKDMTRVERLALSAKELEEWLRDLKRDLGCGGSVEDDALLLQGDQRERAAAWLTARGVGKITKG
jgi:translation initiation factor 1